MPDPSNYYDMSAAGASAATAESEKEGVSNLIKIVSFKTYTCNEKTIDFSSTLDLAYFFEWRNCKSGVTETNVLTVDTSAACDQECEFKKVFKGLRHKLDQRGGNAFSPDTHPQFPVLETWKDNIFFTFGHDWMYRDYLFPAFYVPNTDEQEYALKVVFI